MWTKCACALLALSLAACANSGSQPGSSLASAPPALSFDEAKLIVLSERGRIWKDPYSIRDARISQPYTCTGGLAHIGDIPNACVCVEANARNSLGGYTGLTRNEVLFNGNRIVDVLKARESTYSCGQMVSFPELSAETQASAPPPARR